MSRRIKIASAFTPRLKGYTAMMLVNDLKCSKTVYIQMILIPQMQHIVTSAGDSDIP